MIRLTVMAMIIAPIILTFASDAHAQAAAKKALFIIAPEKFRDEEFNEPRQVLESAGVNVTVASVKAGQCVGTLGSTAMANISIGQANPSDYDIIVFIGGNGAMVYWDDPTAHKIAQEAISQGKILGAICIGPVILAKAGVLDGKNATVYPAESNALITNGAHYTGQSVTVDGKIITANGPKAATQFGKALLKALSE